MHQLRRPHSLSPTRRALLGAGVATLAISLALSIAPAWAKSGNSGTVKLRDAATTELVSDTANDPHVCAFSIVFDYSAPTEGTWRILSWPPTGDGSQVASGTWQTVGGSDETDVLTLDAGHYRLEYQASDASNSSNKTFWVKDGCEGTGGATGGNDQPGDTGGNDQPGDTGGNDQPGDTGDQGQDQQGDTGDQGQDQPGDTGGTDQQGDTGDQGQDQPGDTGGTDQQGDTGDQGQDQQGDTGDQGQDQQGDTGSNEQPGDSGDQTGGEGDVQGTTGGDQGGSTSGDGQGTSQQPSDSGSHDGGTQGVTSPAGGAGNPALPDTSTTPAAVLSPLFAALGLLMVIGAHPFIRRTALADRA